MKNGVYINELVDKLILMNRRNRVDGEVVDQ